MDTSPTGDKYLLESRGRDAGEIDLIGQVGVAQTIVAAGRRGRRRRHHSAPVVSQLLLEDDADAVVEHRVRAVDVERGQADLDHLADHVARLRVGRDSHACAGVARLELRPDRPREAKDAGSGELVVGVDVARVDVGQGDARSGRRRRGFAFRLLRARESVVEERVRGRVLILLRESAHVKSDSGGMGLPG